MACKSKYVTLKLSDKSSLIGHKKEGIEELHVNSNLYEQTSPQIPINL